MSPRTELAARTRRGGVARAHPAVLAAVRVCILGGTQRHRGAEAEEGRQQGHAAAAHLAAAGGTDHRPK